MRNPWQKRWKKMKITTAVNGYFMPLANEGD